jgi:transposase-like protein
MRRKQWSSSEKASIVLDGLKGRPVVELCTSYGISQSMYYKWRDQFLTNAAKAFEIDKITRKEDRLLQENQRLKGVVGELTLELKKNDW